MRRYFLAHAQAFFESLGRLAHAPVATFMTVGVIGITLALPTGFYLLVDNLERVGRGWEGAGQISLFLKADIGGERAEKLADRIRRFPVVARTQYISPDSALAEFKRVSGFGDALDALDRNPLPPVIVVHPRIDTPPEKLETLVSELRAEKEVDIAQLDLEWVRRLHAVLRVAERAAWILASLLAAGVLLIIGNTARLAVLNRKDEIEIIRLVGGTMAFVRRPFLYAGVQQGLAGALLAWLLLALSLFLLGDPVRDLANLYGSEIRAEGPGLGTVAALLGAGGFLGWLGTRLAVGRHLRALER
ncbi:MAG: ABC transporter permease [Pseudomonadota bacterium]|nr:MAG: ABC transporter permease [Pseudomonadota bacterium]